MRKKNKLTGEEALEQAYAAVDHAPLLKSVGVDSAFVAQGVFDGVVNFSPHPWDNAAGALLITRVLSALANAGFLAVALSTATTLVPANQKGRALSILLSGNPGLQKSWTAILNAF